MIQTQFSTADQALGTFEDMPVLDGLDFDRDALGDDEYPFTDDGPASISSTDLINLLGKSFNV